MNFFDSHVAQLGWTQCWQIAVVATVVGILNRLFCARRPHVGYLLWLLVLAKCLTPPVWSSPVGVFSFAPIAGVQVEGVMSPPPVVHRGFEPAVGHDDGVMPDAVEPIGNRPAEAVDLAAAEASEVVGGSDTWAGFDPGAGVVLTIAWLAGVFFFAVRVARGTYVCRSAIRRSAVPLDQPLMELALGLQRRLGIRRRVRVEVVSQPIGPLTFGVVRPRVVLPESVAGGAGEELTLVLAHELVHVRRGDSFVGLLQTLVQCVWWFHPCVWWANRRISIERERCCDEEVLTELACPPARYARSLINALQAKRQPLGSALFVGIRPFEITKQRLEYVMRHTGSGYKKTPWAYWMLFMAAVALVAPATGHMGEPADGGESVQSQKEQQPEKPKPPADSPKSIATQRLPSIKVSNVELTHDEEDGTEIKFQVAAAKGTRFFVEYMHRGVRGATSSNGVWEMASDEGANVRLTFNYRPNFNGNRKQSPLLSQEKSLNYKTEVKGANGPGFSTIVSAPVFGVPAAEKALRVIVSDTEGNAVTAEEWRRVLLVVPKSEANKDIANTTKRTELVVGLYSDTPRAKRSEAEQLTSHWGRYEREIGSAHIEWRLTRTGEGQLAPLTPEAVREILEEAKLGEHPENFEAVLKNVWDPAKLRERLWTPVKFSAIGLKTREDRADDVNLCDGEFHLDYSAANNQVSVYRAGESRLGRMHVSEFRASSGTTIKAFDQELLPNHRIALSAGSDKIIADWTTGFVHQMSFRSHGRASDTFQFGPTRYPGGIVFPKLKIELTYRSDELTGLELIYIDKAVFNEGMMADTFKLAANAGTRVFIFERDPIARPTSFAVREDTKDVAELVRERLEQ